MCQILVEGTKRSSSLDGAKIRAFGAFKVDQDGVQIAHKLPLFQWQDGQKVIVWPEELAPGKARFPTPPWGQRP
jgi:branched-chain amino acid transport system substrate-binding protein